MSKQNVDPKNTVRYLGIAALTMLVLSLVGIVIVASENEDVTPKQEKTKQESTTVKSENYRLVTFIKEGENYPVPQGAEVTLNIDGENFSGVAACNNYFGSFQKDDNDMLVVSPIGSTQMACEQPLMDFEYQYLQVLQTVNSVKTFENKITLYSGTMPNTALDFEPAN